MNQHANLDHDAQAKTVARITAHIRAAVDLADEAEHGRAILGGIFASGLDTVAGGAPQYQAFGNIRADAEWWADCATPVELELYAAAALKRIQRQDFAERARKRLLLALWESLDGPSQTRFVSQLDPGGRFIGRKAE